MGCLIVVNQGEFSNLTAFGGDNKTTWPIDEPAQRQVCGKSLWHLRMRFPSSYLVLEFVEKASTTGSFADPKILPHTA